MDGFISVSEFKSLLTVFMVLGDGGLHGLNGRVVGRRSIAPGFKPRLGYVRRVFYLSLRLITFGGCSTQLAQ